MQVEVTDADREAAEDAALFTTCSGEEFAYEFARHRIAERERVVGEVVAWLRNEARGPYFADLIEAKFGGRDAPD